jgi:hypothetical protein
MRMTWWKMAILVALWWGASELAARADSPLRPAAVTLNLAGLKPLSAVAVSECGMAVALFIQLDSTHLLRADPRQSDLFGVGPDGKMEQQTAGPIAWDDAYKLALSAPISSHVTLPCTDGPNI